MHSVFGNIVDIEQRSIYPGEIKIDNGRIIDIIANQERYSHFILPGFVDSHVHIESSMMTPRNFSDYVISRGTVAVIADPHEIANVMGEEGIRFMLDSAKEASIKIYFTVPSCVPATPFDCSGAELSADDVSRLINTGDFVGLSEMMNVPGVVYKDKEVIAKLDAAKSANLPIDGHAPALSSDTLKTYAAAGIVTDHECSTIEEAREKIDLGMKILMREGSSARNYTALSPLLGESPSDLMFCTDDSHPDDLIERGHIDKMVKWALAEGYDLFETLNVASKNAIDHFNLPVGTLRKGDHADFIIVEDLQTLEVITTYIDGAIRYDKTIMPLESRFDTRNPINNFKAKAIYAEQLNLHVGKSLHTIGVEEGELLTTDIVTTFDDEQGEFIPSIEQDILKIVYLNRYNDVSPRVATIHGFGLKRGAIASSIAHDSHNIIAVGCSNEEIVVAINELIRSQGGIVVADGKETTFIGLPIAGIMSGDSCKDLAKQWEVLHDKTKVLGCSLSSPFMTLAFMSLIVIPKLKIGEKGLFDYDQFAFIEE